MTATWLPLPADSTFPLANLPYGAFRRGNEPRLGCAIGGDIFDLTAAAEAGLFADVPGASGALRSPTLNALAAGGKALHRAVRDRVTHLLTETTATVRDDSSLRSRLLVPQDAVKMTLPVAPGDYTDFYSSKDHAVNVGTMMRGPDNALMPNWLHLPVAYHGRASSIVVSGTDVRRPSGQMRPADAAAPVFGPTRSLDYELEVAAVVGEGNAMGSPICVDDALDHVLGLVLLNDWSARDIQGWEYQPLGPFLGKNFATSISPWVVPLEALEPFRCAAPTQEPEVLPYLREKERVTFDIPLAVTINGTVVTASNFRYLYWTLAQQIAHHTVNGCPLRPGDLIASGTVSGPTPESRGCLLERTWRGAEPVTLGDGSARTFLKDGDRVTMAAVCERGDVRVGFGEVTGVVIA